MDSKKKNVIFGALAAVEALVFVALIGSPLGGSFGDAENYKRRYPYYN
jgi:hypothetical protein